MPPSHPTGRGVRGENFKVTYPKDAVILSDYTANILDEAG